MKRSRRSVLRSSAGVGAGAVALSALAGCLSEPNEGATSDPDGGYAAFFALWDWAQQVSGDHLTLENPVEAGQMGHGWDPQSDLAAEIADSAVFVYLDTPEFSWAQDIAADLETDYDHITLIDGMEGLEPHLLPAGGDHGEEGHDEAEHDDHDSDDAPEFYDPHVWTDPVIVTEIVETIADGLAEADPDNEDAYRDNAAAYAERLEALDEQFQDLVADAERDVAVLAGHDSFRYLEERYGFELHTPAPISPDAEVTTGDLSDTIELVDDRGIETILYDPFDAPEGDIPREAEHLLENSAASEAEPLSPAEGTTAEWNDRGWGWIEQMKELNVPSLRKALGAERTRLAAMEMEGLSSSAFERRVRRQ